MTRGKEVCHSKMDGDCYWDKCPQKIKYASGCPLYDWEEADSE